MPTAGQVYLIGTIFNFGKHRDSDIVDVPSGYLRWCLREITDAPEEFHEEIRAELDRRKHEGVGSFDFDDDDYDEPTNRFGCHL